MDRRRSWFFEQEVERHPYRFGFGLRQLQIM
jgi:hypothetical protein